MTKGVAGFIALREVTPETLRESRSCSGRSTRSRSSVESGKERGGDEEKRGGETVHAARHVDSRGANHGANHGAAPACMASSPLIELIWGHDTSSLALGVHHPGLSKPRAFISRSCKLGSPLVESMLIRSRDVCKQTSPNERPLEALAKSHSETTWDQKNDEAASTESHSASKRQCR